jgi:hypothetical protein
VARSTTTHPNKSVRTERFRINLDHRVDDKSGAYRRKRSADADEDWATYFGRRSAQLAAGFADDWDPTDQATATLQEILDNEGSLERPCTCIGPCFYGSALHPTKEEKEMFATAIKETDKPMPQWERELLGGGPSGLQDWRNAAARKLILGKPKLNPAAGKQFRAEPVKGNPGAPGRKGRARIITGRSI